MRLHARRPPAGLLTYLATRRLCCDAGCGPDAGAGSRWGRELTADRTGLRPGGPRGNRRRRRDRLHCARPSLDGPLWEGGDRVVLACTRRDGAAHHHERAGLAPRPRAFPPRSSCTPASADRGRCSRSAGTWPGWRGRRAKRACRGAIAASCAGSSPASCPTARASWSGPRRHSGSLRTIGESDRKQRGSKGVPHVCSHARSLAPGESGERRR